MRNSNSLYKGFAWYGQFNPSDNSLNSVSFQSKNNNLKADKNYKKYVSDIRKKKAKTYKENENEE